MANYTAEAVVRFNQTGLVMGPDGIAKIMDAFLADPSWKANPITFTTSSATAVKGDENVIHETGVMGGGATPAAQGGYYIRWEVTPDAAAGFMGATAKLSVDISPLGNTAPAAGSVATSDFSAIMENTATACTAHGCVPRDDTSKKCCEGKGHETLKCKGSHWRCEAGPAPPGPAPPGPAPPPSPAPPAPSPNPAAAIATIKAANAILYKKFAAKDYKGCADQYTADAGVFAGGFPACAGGTILNSATDIAGFWTVFGGMNVTGLTFTTTNVIADAAFTAKKAKGVLHEVGYGTGKGLPAPIPYYVRWVATKGKDGLYVAKLSADISPLIGKEVKPTLVAEQ